MVGGYFYQQKASNDTELHNGTPESLEKGEANLQSSIPTLMSEKGVAIVITSPLSGNKIDSPLKVTGSVPGSWSFEGQFIVRLLDVEGNIVSVSTATVQGEWMTEQQVPFNASLAYDNLPLGTGSLVLEKSNPSGLPENDDKLILPVEF